MNTIHRTAREKYIRGEPCQRILWQRKGEEEGRALIHECCGSSITCVQFYFDNSRYEGWPRMWA